jgi:regulator of replication initiation timing
MTKKRWFDFLRWVSDAEIRSTAQLGAAVPAQTGRPRAAVATCLVLVAALLWSALSLAQETATRREVPPAPSLNDAVRALSEQVRQLQQTVAEMRRDSQQARAETRELQREIDELRTRGAERKAVLMDAVARTQTSTTTVPTGNLQDNDREEQKKAGHAASLEEQYDLLSGKVDDQYQTKVESASKYRMRISGIVLMSLFSNQGTVDNIDLPMLAYARPAGYSGGSFGATLRQSEIGFEVFGPRVAGAKTRADLQLDLGGGFPPVPNGISSGLMRLRTATMRMDWENTSVVVGQDGLFFSPSSPTSFATLAMPALSYAGNLWSWVPQIRVEHRVVLGDTSSLLFQGGILDPVSGEVPPSSSYRQPGPGESSRQPAYGTRVAWTHDFFGQPLRVGVGGFYSRQDYGFARTVDAWATMSDLELPLGSKFSVSGKFYRGRGLGGLYGGLGQSVLFSGNSTGVPYTELTGLNTVGGWAQFKYRPRPKLEFNSAFGMDNPYAKDLEYFPNPYSYGDPKLSRNRAGFANVIYRPRSDLLFSAEYRRISTDTISNGANNAGHLNLMMGVLF